MWLAVLSIAGCRESKEIPSIYRPHAGIQDHPLVKLAAKLNPDQHYSIVDYPALKKEYTQRNIFRLVEKDLRERLNVADEQVAIVRNGLEQALTAKFPVTGIIQDRNGKPVRVLVVPEIESDPLIIAANVSGFDPQTLRSASYKPPVLVEELEGAMRMHELAHMIDRSFKGRGEAAMLFEPNGAWGAHRDEMFGDVLSSLFVLRDFDGKACVEFFQDLRCMRIFNHADNWLYSPSEKRTYTQEVQYLTWRASAGALKLHEEGKLKGMSDVELRSLAAKITENVAYSPKEINVIASALRRARSAMGEAQARAREVPVPINPFDIFRGIFNMPAYQSYEINEGNVREKYSQEKRFVQAIQEGYLKENDPYVRRMKEAHSRMLGIK
jgi:hypothetical protein